MNKGVDPGLADPNAKSSFWRNRAATGCSSIFLRRHSEIVFRRTLALLVDSAVRDSPGPANTHNLLLEL